MVWSGPLHGKFDHGVGVDEEDRVENRPESMKPALEGLQVADSKMEKQTKPGVSMGRVQTDRRESREWTFGFSAHDARRILIFSSGHARGIR